MDHRQDISETTAVALIEEQAEARIRRVWHDERWFFSVIDVVGLLTDAPKPRQYWFDMKRTVHTEGFHEVSERIRQLKMRSADGKQRQTDAADVETLLRIIQSIPSPKAEPVKQWLAKVGARRLEEITQPLPPASASSEIAALAQPAETAPALDWAQYYERLAALYRRQAACELRLTVIDATLSQHEHQFGELHSRLESTEEVLRLVPEILERLGPETLTPEHQRTVQHTAKRLHDVGGSAYAGIYADLGEHFHVARYDQIPEARWEDVAEWFRVRMATAERRARR